MKQEKKKKKIKLYMITIISMLVIIGIAVLVSFSYIKSNFGQEPVAVDILEGYEKECYEKKNITEVYLVEEHIDKWCLEDICKDISRECNRNCKQEDMDDRFHCYDICDWDELDCRDDIKFANEKELKIMAIRKGCMVPSEVKEGTIEYCDKYFLTKNGDMITYIIRDGEMVIIDE